MSQKDLSELQLIVEGLEKRFNVLRNKSDAATEIASALDALKSTVAVHRIRAEIRDSKHPFVLQDR